MVRGVTELLRTSAGDLGTLSPIFLPDSRELEGVLHDGVALPAALVDPLTAAVHARLQVIRDGAEPIPASAPQPVVAGSLGEWTEEEVPR
jgi:hypothetical protein